LAANAAFFGGFTAQNKNSADTANGGGLGVWWQLHGDKTLSGSGLDATVCFYGHTFRCMRLSPSIMNLAEEARSQI